jgi:hypothetical protein
MAPQKPCSGQRYAHKSLTHIYRSPAFAKSFFHARRRNPFFGFPCPIARLWRFSELSVIHGK